MNEENIAKVFKATHNFGFLTLQLAGYRTSKKEGVHCLLNDWNYTIPRNSAGPYGSYHVFQVQLTRRLSSPRTAICKCSYKIHCDVN